MKLCVEIRMLLATGIEMGILIFRFFFRMRMVNGSDDKPRCLKNHECTCYDLFLKREKKKEKKNIMQHMK